MANLTERDMQLSKLAGCRVTTCTGEIIMVKAIVSALATYMLYTGHEYPRVNEANILYTFHYTA